MRPKPQTLRSRALLQRLQLGVLLCIGRVDPGHASGNLGGRHIFARTLHIGHGAAVIVPGQRLQPCLLPKAQLRQVLLGAGAKRLFGFGGINGGDAYLDGAIRPRCAAAGGEGVAIADGNNQAEHDSERHEQRRAGTNRGAMEPKGAPLYGDPARRRMAGYSSLRSQFTKWPEKPATLSLPFQSCRRTRI